jgi:uncharacterized membrane protein YkoI
MMRAIVHQPVLAAAMLGAAMIAAATLPHRAASSEDDGYGAVVLAQNQGNQSGKIIPPSMVYRIALEYVPGCTVLKVSLDHASKVYAVKLKSGSEVRKLFVDARTGRVVGN